MQVHPSIERLDDQAHEIARMICSEQVSAAEIDTAICALRARFEAALGDRPDVFDHTYGRRFRRLRTRFQPVRSLFASG